MENNQEGHRIHNLDELIELWPEVLLRMRKTLGVTAVAYLHNAAPVALNEEEVVLEYQRQFRFEKAIEASERFAYQKVLNECLATPHHLRFQLSQYPDE